MSEFNTPPLPGDMRDLILFAIQDIKARLDWVEEKLCVDEDEEEEDENDSGT